MKNVYLSFLLIMFGAFSINAQTFKDIDAGIIGVKYNASSAWGDYDNDNFIDLVICGEPEGGVDTTLLYHNNGDGTFTVVDNPGFIHVTTGDLEWGDFNNDTFLDLLIMGYGNDVQQLKLYINNGDGTFTEQTSTGLPTGLYMGDLDFADFNNDGYLDIGLSGMDDTWTFITTVFENNHDLTFTKLADLNLEGLNFGVFKWGDYDGDGYSDFVISGYGDDSFVTQLWKNNQDETFSQQTGVALRQCWLGDIEWGDYDNDNDLDLFISGTGGDGTERATLIYTNNNDGTFTEETISLPAVSHSSLELVDFDGDNDLDLFVAGTTDGMATGNYIGEIRYNNDGDFSTSESFPITYWGVCNAADFDNNGYADLFICGYDQSDVAFSELYKNDRVASVNLFTNNNVNITPNPARNFLKLESDNLISKFKVYNLTGKLVLSKKLNTKKATINIENLNSGIYFIKIQTSTGEFSEKVIID